MRAFAPGSTLWKEESRRRAAGGLLALRGAWRHRREELEAAALSR